MSKPITKESTRVRRWRRIIRHLRAHSGDKQAERAAARIGQLQVSRKA